MRAPHVNFIVGLLGFGRIRIVHPLEQDYGTVAPFICLLLTYNVRLPRIHLPTPTFFCKGHLHCTSAQYPSDSPMLDRSEGGSWASSYDFRDATGSIHRGVTEQAYELSMSWRGL